MSQIVANHEVLTLEEAASYLRVSSEVAEQLATHGVLPARRVQDQWRFLRSALDDWLRGTDYKQMLLGQAGALKDDDSLDALRGTIYTERGRPDDENSTLLALPWKTAYTQTLLFRLIKAAREAAASKSHARLGVTP